MKKSLKEIMNLPLSTLLIILIIILSWVLVVVVWPFAWNSSEMGQSYGSVLGNGVGLAIGSYNGLTSGFEEGKEAGLSDALNSEDDIRAEIENSVHDIGNLEVLVAGFSVQNFHEIGDEYASLEILKGNAVFSINLNNAEFSYNRDGTRLTVFLDEPEIDIYINEDETEQLAEYQKYPWSGSAENGYKAYLNSRANTAKEIKETMDNYDELMQMAKDAATKEVKRLAEAICISSDQEKNRDVIVMFKGGN